MAGTVIGMPDQVWKSVATLDTKIAGTLPPRGEKCPETSVHAQDTRGPSFLFRLETKQRQIARGANLSQSTVHEYVERFRAAGLSWPLPEQMSESELEAGLFPDEAGVSGRAPRHPPDFSYIHQQLQEHKHVTLQLLWEEYQ